MKPDVKAIRARAEAATPGPWRAGSRETWHVFGAIGDPTLLAPALGRVVARINQHFPHEADATFIAAAREDVPALCARIEELEAALRIAVDALGVASTPLPRDRQEVRAAIEQARAALEGQ